MRDVDKINAESGNTVSAEAGRASNRAYCPPTDAFSLSYGIGWAVAQLKHGLKLRRRGWNGRGMYVALQVPEERSANTLPYVWIRTAQGERVPWLCSQTDLLANDWEVATVEE